MDFDKINKICYNCKSPFTKKTTESKKYWARKKYCSVKCGGYQLGHQLSEAHITKLKTLTGELASRYKAGRVKLHTGYIGILVKGTGTYDLEHRRVMETYCQRKLTPIEHVHHINGDKEDNRIENLVVIDIVEHGRLHANQRWS